MGGKVLTAKLPLPANSKIVTVNVPTTQGGTVTPMCPHLRHSEREVSLEKYIF
jgi:hypothetical protein